MDIPTNEPSSLRAGDTWQWRREDLASDYPAGTWTLTYRFKNAAGGFEVVASADGSNFAIEVAATTTANIAAGTYSWAAQVVNGTTKHTVDSGTFEVLANLFSGTAGTASDQRTHNQIVFDAIKAVMKNRATKDQQEYMIAGRKLVLTPMADLIKLFNFYETRVAADLAAENLRNGRNVPRVIQVRG